MNGPMGPTATLRILNAQDLEGLLSYDWVIDAVDRVMREVSAGNTVLPLRTFMDVPDTPGRLGLMPGYVAHPPCFGVKVVSKFPPAISRIPGSHAGMVVIFDTERGLPLAILEGATLTAIRTAAASAVATRALARPGATTLAILGCGEQALRHVQALQAVMDLRRPVVWGRSADKAAAFARHCESLIPQGRCEVAASVAEAVREADVVCTTTTATTPILEGAALRAGTHINLVGAAIRTSAEADHDVVTRSSFFVDYRPSAMAQAGELLNAIEAGQIAAEHVVGEIGEVLSGRMAGRTGLAEITVYKSLGIAAQDLGVALEAVARSRSQGVGRDVPWP